MLHNLTVCTIIIVEPFMNLFLIVFKCILLRIFDNIDNFSFPFTGVAVHAEEGNFKGWYRQFSHYSD